MENNIFSWYSYTMVQSLKYLLLLRIFCHFTRTRNILVVLQSEKLTFSLESLEKEEIKSNPSSYN